MPPEDEEEGGEWSLENHRRGLFSDPDTVLGPGQRQEPKGWGIAGSWSNP